MALGPLRVVCYTLRRRPRSCLVRCRPAVSQFLVGTIRAVQDVSASVPVTLVQKKQRSARRCTCDCVDAIPGYVRRADSDGTERPAIGAQSCGYRRPFFRSGDRQEACLVLVRALRHGPERL